MEESGGRPDPSREATTDGLNLGCGVIEKFRQRSNLCVWVEKDLAVGCYGSEELDQERHVKICKRWQDSSWDMVNLNPTTLCCPLDSLK